MTPAEIAALSPEDRTQLLRALCVARYGPTKSIEALAAEMGVGVRTAYDWIGKNNTPLAVLYALQAWADIATVAVRYQRP